MTTIFRTIGFIGTGTIAEAVVRGMLREGVEDWSVVLSPRTRGTADKLAREFGAVTVAASNQEVVDSADLVVLSVRPDVAEEVVRPLVLPEGGILVSVVATLGLDRLRTWVGEGVRLVRALPLPFVAEGHGVTMVMPPDRLTMEIFGSCGKAVGCDTVEEFELLTTASALMGSYFGLLEHVASWLELRGLPRADADAYLRTLFSSLGAVAERSSASFEKLRMEYSTKGGLNEQIFRSFAEAGGTLALEEALSKALARVREGRGT